LNCAWFRRIGLGDDLADDIRAVIELPGRPGKVCADLPALLVKEIGSGALNDHAKPPSLASQV